MEISVIIPASNKNKYNLKGDLGDWGSTTLLEWKISQAKKIKRISDIYISTNDKEIIEIAKHYKLKFLNRNYKRSLSDLYKSSCQRVKSNYILWLNCSFPFMSEKTINNFIDSFYKKRTKFDSAFMYYSDYEYFFMKKKPINFDLNNMLVERKNLTPLKKIIPGATIFQKKSILKNNCFGSKPFFKKINWLESIELKNIKSYSEWFELSALIANDNEK